MIFFYDILYLIYINTNSRMTSINSPQDTKLDYKNDWNIDLLSVSLETSIGLIWIF